MAGKDPFEGLEERLEAFMSAREKKAAMAKDPKARFEAALERLEGFLDAVEEGTPRKRKPAAEDAGEGKGGDIFDQLFAKRE